MPTDPATVRPLTDAGADRLIDATGFFNRQEARRLARAAYALAASRVDTAEVERRAAREALTKLALEVVRWRECPMVGYQGILDVRNKCYPEPTPRECVLSDGSVVRWTGAWFTRDNAMGHAIEGNENPLALLTKQHIGADFDKLKAFAAEVGQ